MIGIIVGALLKEFCSSRSGADPRGEGGDCPPKTYGSNFIYHNFVQFGKQHSRHTAILSSIVLSQQCCEVYFISLTVAKLLCDLITKYYWNPPPLGLTGWIRPCSQCWVCANTYSVMRYDYRIFRIIRRSIKNWMLAVLFTYITYIRRVQWSKTVRSQTVFNSFTITPQCRSRHWEFNLSLHTRKFDLSHLPNPLDTNRIK